MAKAMVNTVRPNAKETPRSPMPTSGKAAASTALPHPPSTNPGVLQQALSEQLDLPWEFFITVRNFGKMRRDELLELYGPAVYQKG